MLWKYFYTANSHWLNLVRKALFILEDYFGFYKNYSKTYRDVGGMRNRTGYYSLFVQQLHHKPVSLGQSSKGLHKCGRKIVDAVSTGVIGNPEHICCGNHGESQQKLVPPGRAEVPCSLQSYISPADTCCYCLSVLSNLISPNSVPHIFKRHFEYQWWLEMQQTRGLRQLTCKRQCILSLPTVLSQMSFIFPLCDVSLGNQMQINITLEKMEKEDTITFI